MHSHACYAYALERVRESNEQLCMEQYRFKVNVHLIYCKTSKSALATRLTREEYCR